MQQQGSSVSGTGSIVLRYGLIFGLIQTIIHSVVLLSNTFIITSNSVLILVLNGVVFLIGLAAYFIAGMIAAKRSGKVGVGTISGLWTGIFYGIFMFIISLIVFFEVTLPRTLHTYAMRGSQSLTLLENIGAPTGVIIAILGLLFAIGLGAGMGALGGLLGRSLGKPAAMPFYAGPPPYQAQPYPMQPYAGYAYPPTPFVQQGLAPQVGHAELSGRSEQSEPNPYNLDQPYYERPH